MSGRPDYRARTPPVPGDRAPAAITRRDQPRSGRDVAPRSDNQSAHAHVQEEVHAPTADGPSARPGLPGSRLPAVRCGCGASLLDSGRMAARQTDGATTWEGTAVSQGHAHRVREQPTAPLARPGRGRASPCQWTSITLRAESGVPAAGRNTRTFSHNGHTGPKLGLCPQGLYLPALASEIGVPERPLGRVVARG